MKSKPLRVVLLAVLAILSIQLVLAAEVNASQFEGGNLDGVEGVAEVTSMISRIIALVQYTAGGVAVLLLAITGIQFMGARDPVDKKQLGDRLKYILIGLAIVVLSFPIVKLIL